MNERDRLRAARLAAVAQALAVARDGKVPTMRDQTDAAFMVGALLEQGWTIEPVPAGEGNAHAEGQ